MIIDYLKDLVAHTSGLGINSVKVTGDENTVLIEGSDENNKTLVIKGKFLKEVPEFEGVCGLGNLAELTGYVNAYKHKDDVATVVREDKTYTQKVVDDDGNDVLDDSGEPETETVTNNVITEIHFKRATQMKNEYRVMNLRGLPDQPKFGGLPWEIVIEPTKRSIDMMATQAGFNVENFFGVTVDDGTMFLTFGNTAMIEFAYDVDGDITRAWTWELSKVLPVLKLSADAECVMSFSNKGALQITLTTGLAEYNYIIPAKAPNS